MVRRFLIALLLLALSAPALAMSGHCAPQPAMPTTAHAPTHASHHAPVAPHAERRDCIGCVLPGIDLAPAMESRSLFALVGSQPARAALTRAQDSPETPPPRA